MVRKPNRTTNEETKMKFLFGKKQTVQVLHPVLEAGRNLGTKEMVKINYREYSGAGLVQF